MAAANLLQAPSFATEMIWGTGSGGFSTLVLAAMVRSFVVVRDPAPARAFFAALGFGEAVSFVIKGELFARYMGVPGIEAVA